MIPISKVYIIVDEEADYFKATSNLMEKEAKQDDRTCATFGSDAGKLNTEFTKYGSQTVLITFY